MSTLPTWAAATATAVLLAACSGTTEGGDHPRAAPRGAECSPSGPSLSISAKNNLFDTDCLAVAAGEKFTVAFDNDEDVPHNFAILPRSGKGEALFDTGVFNGPEVRNLEAGPLEAGNYTFHCVVHPNMVGSFVVR